MRSKTCAYAWGVREGPRYSVVAGEGLKTRLMDRSVILLVGLVRGRPDCLAVLKEGVELAGLSAKHGVREGG